jgi:hypothetical protein
MRHIKPRLVESEFPKKERLIYLGLLKPIQFPHGRVMARVRRGRKRFFKEEVKSAIESLYASWSGIRGSLEYPCEDAVQEAYDLIDEVWREVFQGKPAEEAPKAMGEKRETYKKWITVRRDLLNATKRIVGREGKTLGGFVNEIFEQALRAHEMKTSLTKALDAYETIKSIRESGAFILPAELLNHLVTRLYPVEKENLLDKAYSSGQWYGEYLQTRFHGRDTVEVLHKMLSYASSFTEVSLSRKGTYVELRCVSTSQPPETTELLSRFIEGAMHSLGYETLKRTVSNGLILMSFSRAKTLITQ